MPTTKSEPKILNWDSEFWHTQIGRITTASLVSPDVLKVWTQNNAVECLFLECPCDDMKSLHKAQDIGFRVMDTRVDYEYVLNGLRPEKALSRIRPATSDDLSTMSDIARSAHRDSRFFSDPHFSDARCEEFYIAWIVNSCIAGFADWVLVAESAGSINGYVTGRRETSGVGRIGLIAVATHARGNGIATQLVSAAVQRFITDSIRSVRVTTQVRNIGAQRLYQRCGFVTREVAYVLHYWTNND